MIRTGLAGADLRRGADRWRAGAIERGSGQARRLSGQQHHDLRQLPHAEGTAGDIPGKAFSGGLSWDEPPFKVTAPNITQDKDTGIGNWSDADIKTLLRNGVRPNGVPLATVMPTGFYDILTERDLDAIVAYLRTLKPIKNKVPDPIYKMRRCTSLPRRREALYRGHDEGQGQARLLSRHHRPLHGMPYADGTARPRFATKLGNGGFEFPGPWGKSVSRNITSSKTKGIGAWTDAEIKRAITTGVARTAASSSRRWASTTTPR